MRGSDGEDKKAVSFVPPAKKGKLSHLLHDNLTHDIYLTDFLTALTRLFYSHTPRKEEKGKNYEISMNYELRYLSRSLDKSRDRFGTLTVIGQTPFTHYSPCIGYAKSATTVA